MSRESLSTKMKNGPPLSFVAKKLGISRPTLYRHMEFYVAGEDSKIDPHLKEYFDKVVMDQYADVEEMKKDLEQIREFMDADKETRIEDFKNEYTVYQERKNRFDEHEDSMSSDERNKEHDALKKIYSGLKEKAKELDIDIDDYFPEIEIERPEIVWNEGEIRSAPAWGLRSPLILIDADFDRCRDITVELVVTVSGKDFVYKRIKPQENDRYVKVEFGMPTATGYRLKWNSGDKVKYTPVYPCGD